MYSMRRSPIYAAYIFLSGLTATAFVNYRLPDGPSGEVAFLGLFLTGFLIVL
jgi:hypothetical protein